MSEPARAPAATPCAESSNTTQTEPAINVLATLPLKDSSGAEDGAVPVAEVGGALPERFGRYLIRKQLGRGGMGTVYLAYDTRIDRQVALKVPHPDIACDSLSLERFYREARAAGRLRHPHICPVYDVDHVDGRHFLTMAYVEGRPLSEVARSYPDRPAEAVMLVRKLALALAEAHVSGVIHRDLKPSNIMLDGRGEPIVMDFGLARRIAAEGADLSFEGLILGTPSYMSPEQAAGNVTLIGPASDIYSLGVILYELLTGTIPFRGNTSAVLAQVLRDEPPPPSRHRPELDPRLETVCLQALAKDPSGRPAGMLRLAELLTACLEQVDQPAPRQPEKEEPSLRLVDAILQMLRQWGCTIGIEKARSQTASGPQTMASLTAWLGGDLASENDARQAIAGLPQEPALAAWALVGQGFRAVGRFEFGQAEQCLKLSRGQAVTDDPVLEANLLHLEGLLLWKRNRWAEAIAPLHGALALLGRDHFLTGDVLATLARVYSYKGNFTAAREYGEQALRCKQGFPRDASLSLLRQELARLHLDWSELDRAEGHLQEALKLIPKGRGDATQASLHHDLGRVVLARISREQGRARPTDLRKWTAQANDYFDLAFRFSQRGDSPVLEAWVRMYRSLLRLFEGRLVEAEEDLDQSRSLFEERQVDIGLAETQRALGLIRRAQSRFDESEQALRAALTQCEAHGRHVDAARTQLELARTLQAGGAAPRQVTLEYLEALQRAEGCRRADLVAVIDEELRAVDEEAYWRYAFRRSRGHGHPEGTGALGDGSSETATVLFLNLRQFVPFSQGLDPEQVMQALNQIIGDLDAVLEKHDAHTTALLGGGFMALLRHAGHAERAVRAALDLLQVVSEFNRPREVLGLRILPAGVGVASGALCLGNVGSYRKMDFTAVGMPVNLAARLVREADPAMPCVSEETFRLVRDRFLFGPNNPRRIELKGLGARDVYDVMGCNLDSSSGISRR